MEIGTNRVDLVAAATENDAKYAQIRPEERLFSPKMMPASTPLGVDLIAAATVYDGFKGPKHDFSVAPATKIERIDVVDRESAYL